MDGGWRPIPDPTVLTTEQLNRAILAERDFVKGQLQVLEERLAGIDRATELRLRDIVEIPRVVDEKVGNLQELAEEKFSSIQTQFLERDTRQEREARDNKVAVDAAFAAQKEAAAKQDEGNQKAIDKSERATAETIKTLADANAQSAEALGGKIDDLKERVARVESAKQGATEQRIETRAGLTSINGVVATGLSIAAFAGGYLVFHRTTSSPPTVTVPTVITVTTP